MFCCQTPEEDASIQSISIDPMGTMMSAINNKVRGSNSSDDQNHGKQNSFIISVIFLFLED